MVIIACSTSAILLLQQNGSADWDGNHLTLASDRCLLSPVWKAIGATTTIHTTIVQRRKIMIKASQQIFFMPWPVVRQNDLIGYPCAC
jgi:hypothetical protein